ncbi:hypothetical protein CVT26_008913 [Gymnopilus dilepis]|uniref:Uncharacterized protein n=1 Tax=Gymnopilus dilepis TaxID=231916 RepID=A0A409YRU9_9AGAR|nr:hypothetical protein CVT26_008913 [Gymnopilus dilepis]
MPSVLSSIKPSHPVPSKLPLYREPSMPRQIVTTRLRSARKSMQRLRIFLVSDFYPPQTLLALTCVSLRIHDVLETQETEEQLKKIAAEFRSIDDDIMRLLSFQGCDECAATSTLRTASNLPSAIPLKTAKTARQTPSLGPLTLA